MEQNDIIEYFTSLIRKDKDKSVGLAAIETLMKALELSQCTTIQELRYYMLNAIDAIKSTDHPVTSITSGSELFLRFITLTNLDNPSYDECKKMMMSRGQTFINKLSAARQKIADIGSNWIRHGYTILTHSKSRVVLKTLKVAAEKNVLFTVYVTSEEMHRDLQKLNVKSTLIKFSTIGSIMRTVDIVLFGAEGVCQSGGIINKTGTLMVAMCARAMNKKVIILAESFKLTTIFPFNDQTLPEECKYTRNMLNNEIQQNDPIVDYTPPEYIDQIITDTGVFNPVTVVDQILQLYV